MDNTPSVSVIMPFYNGAAFVDDRLAMLKRQSFSDFEWIVVNDGSADDTSARLHRLETMDLPFSVRVVDRENGGVAAARNSGAAVARGRWLCFLDDDDTVSDFFLSLLYRAATDCRTDLALGLVTRTGDDLYHTNKSDAKAVLKADFLKTYLYEGIGYSHCCALIARDLFLKAGGYPAGYRYSEDVFLLWKMITLCDRVAVVPHPLYYYEFNESSAMNKTMTAERMQAIRLMEKLEPFMDEFAPDFAPEYRKYEVARHYWSILWQAAGCFDSYRAFKTYLADFPEVGSQLKKLSDYPDKKVVVTAKLFTVSRRLYYTLMHFYVKKIK